MWGRAGNLVFWAEDGRRGGEAEKRRSGTVVAVVAVVAVVVVVVVYSSHCGSYHGGVRGDHVATAGTALAVASL